jgi:hypothetical protein
LRSELAHFSENPAVGDYFAFGYTQSSGFLFDGNLMLPATTIVLLEAHSIIVFLKIHSSMYPAKIDLDQIIRCF